MVEGFWGPAESVDRDPPRQGSGTRRILCAILLNPPLRPAVETISYRNLIVALPLINCDSLLVSNLVDLPTRDQVGLSGMDIKQDDLLRSRRSLSVTLDIADEVLFAWGTGRVGGASGALLKDQAAWAEQQVISLGFKRVWMVAGSPRHPSRWRQYVGPQKRRVQGNSFAERLGKVLEARPIE